MLNRRTWLGLAAGGLLTSACASLASEPDYTLAQVLRDLPDIPTGARFIDKFGTPQSRSSFDHDNPRSDRFVSQLSKEEWKRFNLTSPADLIDTLPIGTLMLLYRFAYGSWSIPTVGMLAVCVDESDRVIGWMWETALRGQEGDALLRNIG